MIERLIPQAANRLREGGYLMMEISPMIADAVQDMVRGDGRLGEPEVVKDAARLARIVMAQRTA